jgi:3-oxoacyl-[acyl-carrier protein] reductase
MINGLSQQPIALVFGGMGSLGEAISKKLIDEGFFTLVTTSKQPELESQLPNVLWINPAVSGGLDALDNLPKLDVVVWAQGVNAGDSCTDFAADIYQHLMSVNVDFVVHTLGRLTRQHLLSTHARLCVISSIWQMQARSGKFSYTISKAALAGLVRSAAVDLGREGIKINAVLPGVVDTPMTRSNLSEAQIDIVKSMTPLGRLATPEDVSQAVWSLVSPANRSITGESLLVDGGFSCARTFNEIAT